MMRADTHTPGRQATGSALTWSKTANLSHAPPNIGPASAKRTPPQADPESSARTPARLAPRQPKGDRIEAIAYGLPLMQSMYPPAPDDPVAAARRAFSGTAEVTVIADDPTASAPDSASANSESSVSPEESGICSTPIEGIHKEDLP